MAAGRLSKPGSEFGPCFNDCKHLDCKQTREMAAYECLYCHKPIGYDTRFYLLPLARTVLPGELVHAACYEEIITLEQMRQDAEVK